VSGRRGDALSWGPGAGEVAAGAGRRAPPRPPPREFREVAASPEGTPAATLRILGGGVLVATNYAVPFLHPRAR